MQTSPFGATPGSAPPWWVRLCQVLWKVIASLGTVVILSVVAGLIDTWLTSSKGMIPADSPLRWLLAQWPIIVPMGGCLLLLAFLTFVLSRWPTQSPFASSSRPQQTRAVLLGCLRHRYQQYHEQSLQNVVKVELGLASRPDAIQNAAPLLFRRPNRPERVLPPGTSIVQVYEEANHELLILGEPGVGKSTLLVALAQHLVERAEREETHPLPILLSLLSWAVKRPRMQDWLIEQISQTYGVSRWISQQLVREEQILLLLDGLDEMEETARVACVTEINAYHHEHLLVPLVICSRTAEYERATVTERLALQSSVVVQPLTSEQIDAALASIGTSVAGLRTELRKNSTLAELATTPLLLDVLLLVYQGKAPRGLSKQRNVLLLQVWTTYVERMIERKGDAQRYPLPQTITWLGWLAWQMLKHNQAIFYLERLQPDWLTKRDQTAYRWSVVLVIGLFGGLLGGLFLGPVGGLVCGLCYLPRALFVGLQSKIELAEVQTWSWKDALLMLFVCLTLGLLVGLIIGLFLGLKGVLFGLLLGLLFGSLFGSLFGFSGKVLPEHLPLSPNKGIRRSAGNGVHAALTALLGSGLVFALVFTLFGGVINRLSHGLVGSISSELGDSTLGAGIAFGNLIGLLIGPLVGLSYGLGAFVQHCVLRFWLQRRHVFPWKAVQFLEVARTRIFLRRVGRGYGFVHRELLDFFAALYLVTSVPAAPASSTPTRTSQPVDDAT